jgi:oligopeptide/dipeptide ABC transporter ATP-binding protein
VNPLLAVQDLEACFFTRAGAVKAVDGVSYSIARGETLGIVGESGCGKSVTSFSILGLLSPPGVVTAGRALLDGQDLLSLSETQMQQVRGKRIAMIFQEPMTALNPVLSIGAQIIEQIQHHEADFQRGEAKERTVDLLEHVGIPSPEKCIDHYPHQLSGGMRQRAMIAMALSCKPELLIADEPTTALDVTIQAQILSLLQSLQDELGMAMQFITHDLGVISEIADRVVVMYAGKIVETAPSEELFRDPKHPYTIGLLESIPRIDAQTRSLTAIEGSVPELLNLPPGCRFRSRCPRAISSCAQSEPPLTPSGAKRELACFNPH